LPRIGEKAGCERDRRVLNCKASETDDADAAEKTHGRPFSGEDVGWQVWFEGETTGHDTDALISQIAHQVEEFTAGHTEWIRFG